MSTIHNRKSRVTKVQKRPKKTLFKVKTAQVLFRDKTTKKLKIPELYDCYNYNMLAVNIADQLASLNSSHQQIRRGI
jgi:hypothetical protein